ncbi:hypothetical protein WR25_02538 [Diploscapter pachys]|uniref:Uncharacterized protein n=1 Tax=Diploscapter pachys TaxID=2018661 RepID=A0A2A2KU80_9BILA|nr:hypothetical protein WR25_02538 [Diploscapter pachys]
MAGYTRDNRLANHGGLIENQSRLDEDDAARLNCVDDYRYLHPEAHIEAGRGNITDNNNTYCKPPSSSTSKPLPDPVPVQNPEPTYDDEHLALTTTAMVFTFLFFAAILVIVVLYFHLRKKQKSRRPTPINVEVGKRNTRRKSSVRNNGPVRAISQTRSVITKDMTSIENPVRERPALASKKSSKDSIDSISNWNKANSNSDEQSKNAESKQTKANDSDKVTASDDASDSITKSSMDADGKKADTETKAMQPNSTNEAAKIDDGDDTSLNQKLRDDNTSGSTINSERNPTPILSNRLLVSREAEKDFMQLDNDINQFMTRNSSNSMNSNNKDSRMVAFTKMAPKLLNNISDRTMNDDEYMHSRTASDAHDSKTEADSEGSQIDIAIPRPGTACKHLRRVSLLNQSRRLLNQT